MASAELNPERAIVPIVRSTPRHRVSEVLGTAFCLATATGPLWMTAKHVFEMSPLNVGEKYAVVFRDETGVRIHDISPPKLSDAFDIACFEVIECSDAHRLRLASQDPHLNADILSFEYSQTRIERDNQGRLLVSFEPYSHKGHTLRRFVSTYPERTPTPSCLVSFPALQGASGAPLLCSTRSKSEIVVTGMLVANVERELLPAQTIRIEQPGGVVEETKYCPRRFEFDPPCRLNSDPGTCADRVLVDCG